MQLDEILTIASQKGASDVHLKAGLVPVIRKHGVLRPLSKESKILTQEDIEVMAQQLMDEEQLATFKKEKEIDLGYGIQNLGRFRINIFRQRGSIRMVIRNIPTQIPTIEELNLPKVVAEISEIERGLVLVTGITGSGKSSTLAAMLNHINNNKNRHIVTIEDPIEFLLRDKRSIVSQRELGSDTTSFNKALRSALRQDPDVILIGEMRDMETIKTALTAAETGHLVLSTLHTLDAQETINRIVGIFDPHEQQQIRLQLAVVLKAVISQRLAQRKDKKGYVPAMEILIANARIQKLIEDPTKTREITRAIEESRTSRRMQSFDQSLMELIGKDLIDFEEAVSLSSNPQDFALRYAGVNPLERGGEKWSNTGTAINKKYEDAWDKLDTLEIETFIRKSKEKDKSAQDDEDDED